MTAFTRSQGVLRSPKGEVTRQVFFPLTQEILDYMDENGTQGLYSSSFTTAVDLEKYLDLLPALEGEVLFLLCLKKKTQKDVARLLETSQPTVSYRYRRAIDKLSYLIALDAADLESVVRTVPQIKEKERDILRALFFTANQELVGVKFGVRQSSVKWIFCKSMRYVAALEEKEPLVWSKHYAMFLLLERNLRKRIFS